MLHVRMLLTDPFSVTAAVASLARSGRPAEALRTFVSVLSSSGAAALDSYTFPPVLRSCALAGAPAAAAAVHGLAAKLGVDCCLFVASSLVVSYASLSHISSARSVFDGMRERDSVLWTAMLSGYAQSGMPLAAMEFFRIMAKEAVVLDEAVMVSLLLACGQLGWLRHGQSIHACCFRRLPTTNLTLGNAIVDMYVKCGAFRPAELMFWRMPVRDVISWSSLILGYGLSGCADFALGLFEQMVAEGVRPNSVTFLGVLSACGHSGKTAKAWEVFNRMKLSGLEPELKHYSCMVDALGKAGQTKEAERFIEDMPLEPDEAILGSLLASCRLHRDMEVADRVSRRLLQMHPTKGGYYMNVANVYSDAGRYSDAARLRESMKEANVQKLLGQSTIGLSSG